MRRHITKLPIEDLDERPLDWVDESLDEDALDLDEWAFLHGYYGEV